MLRGGHAWHVDSRQHALCPTPTKNPKTPSRCLWTFHSPGSSQCLGSLPSLGSQFCSMVAAVHGTRTLLLRFMAFACSKMMTNS